MLERLGRVYVLWGRQVPIEGPRREGMKMQRKIRPLPVEDQLNVSMTKRGST